MPKPLTLSEAQAEVLRRLKDGMELRNFGTRLFLWPSSYAANRLTVGVLLRNKLVKHGRKIATDGRLINITPAGLEALERHEELERSKVR